MYVHESGSSGQPAIVFLHGNGANGTMWQPHVERLAGYHCLAPDLPGYGQSNGQEWVSLDRTADQVTDLIRSRASDGRAHVVGLSLGSSVLLTLLSRSPDVIGHAIVDGAGILPQPGLTFKKAGFHVMQPFLHSEFVIKTIARSFKIPSDRYEEFSRGMLEMSPSSFTRSSLEALSFRDAPGLEKVTCPVLFVAGQREAAAVHRSNVLLAGVMPHAQARVAPGVAHGWLAAAPELHLRMVKAWIEDQPLPDELVDPVTGTRRMNP
jgi:pimeloyl-ACP methyl ester carboxylesterase